MIQRFNFVDQKRIPDESVSIGWRPTGTTSGEFHLIRLDLSDLRLPDTAEVYLKVKWPGFGVKTVKAGTCGNVALGTSINFDEQFIAEANVSVFVTNTDELKTKIAVSAPSLFTPGGANQVTESLLPRQKDGDLGDVPWRLKVTPHRMILLVNRDWPNIFDRTGDERFQAFDLPDILRQAALVVADKQSDLNEDHREAWMRFFCKYTTPPPVNDGEDFAEERELWAQQAAMAVTKRESLKDRFLAKEGDQS